MLEGKHQWMISNPNILNENLFRREDDLLNVFRSVFQDQDFYNSYNFNDLAIENQKNSFTPLIFRPKSLNKGAEVSNGIMDVENISAEFSRFPSVKNCTSQVKLDFPVENFENGTIETIQIK